MSEPLHMAMRTRGGMNAHELPMARHRRVKKEIADVTWFLTQYRRHHGKPSVPCSVLLTRIAPSNGLDDDNLVSSLKSVRDAIANWLGVDDKKRDVVRYRYSQRRGNWGVEIQFGEPAIGAQFVLEAMQ